MTSTHLNHRPRDARQRTLRHRGVTGVIAVTIWDSKAFLSVNVKLYTQYLSWLRHQDDQVVQVDNFKGRLIEIYAVQHIPFVV